MRARIVLLPGDGIGPEVTESAAQVLRTIGTLAGWELTFEEAWIGGAAYERSGLPLDPDTLRACRSADAVLLGAVGGPRWDHLAPELRPEAGLLALRRELGVFANIRPIAVYPELFARTPFRPEILAGVDLIIVRELTGGLYFGEKAGDADQAYDVCHYSREEILRVGRVAAALALSRRGKLTSIDKANVLATSRLWREVLSELVATEFPTLELEHVLVDAAAMYLMQRPASFDVIVTENLFGDILSDQASTLTGSLGLLPSASLGDGSCALYEPVHGSAPSLAGRNAANPIGAILSVALMLRYTLEAPDWAERLEAAVARVVKEAYLTADLTLEGAQSTRAVTARICQLLATPEAETAAETENETEAIPRPRRAGAKALELFDEA